MKGWRASHDPFHCTCASEKGGVHPRGAVPAAQRTDFLLRRAAASGRDDRTRCQADSAGLLRRARRPRDLDFLRRLVGRRSRPCASSICWTSTMPRRRSSSWASGLTNTQAIGGDSRPRARNRQSLQQTSAHDENQRKPEMRQELSDMAGWKAITRKKADAVPSTVWGLQQRSSASLTSGVRGGTVEHRFAGLEEQGRC